MKTKKIVSLLLVVLMLISVITPGAMAIESENSGEEFGVSEYGFDSNEIIDGANTFADDFADGLDPSLRDINSDNVRVSFRERNVAVRSGESTNVNFVFSTAINQSLHIKDRSLKLMFSLKQGNGPAGIPDGVTVDTFTSTQAEYYTPYVENDRFVLEMKNFHIPAGSSGVDAMFKLNGPNGILNNGEKFTILVEAYYSPNPQNEAYVKLPNAVTNTMVVTTITDLFQWDNVRRNKSPNYNNYPVTSTTLPNFSVDYTTRDLISAGQSGQSYIGKLIVKDTIIVDPKVAVNESNITITNSDKVKVKYTKNPNGTIKQIDLEYTYDNTQDRKKNPTPSPLFKVTFSGVEIIENNLSMGENTINAISSTKGSPDEVAKAYPLVSVEENEGNKATDTDSTGLRYQALTSYETGFSFSFKYTKQTESGNESARITKTRTSDSEVYAGDRVTFRLSSFGNFSDNKTLNNFKITDVNNPVLYPVSIKTGAYAGTALPYSINLYDKNNVLVGTINTISDNSSVVIDLVNTTNETTGSNFKPSDLYSVEKIVFDYGNISADFRNTSPIEINYIVKKPSTTQIDDAKEGDNIVLKNEAEVSYSFIGTPVTMDNPSVASVNYIVINTEIIDEVEFKDKELTNLTNPDAKRPAKNDVVRFTISHKNETEFDIESLFILDQPTNYDWIASALCGGSEHTGDGPNNACLYVRYFDENNNPKDVKEISASNIKAFADEAAFKATTGYDANTLTALQSSTILFDRDGQEWEDDEFIYIPVPIADDKFLPGWTVEVVFELVVATDTEDRNVPISNMFETWGAPYGDTDFIIGIGEGYNKHFSSGKSHDPNVALSTAAYNEQNEEISYKTGTTPDASTAILNKDDIITVQTVLESKSNLTSADMLSVVDMVLNYNKNIFEFVDDVKVEHYSAQLGTTRTLVEDEDYERKVITPQRGSTDSSSSYLRYMFVKEEAPILPEDPIELVPESLEFNKGDKIIIEYQLKVTTVDQNYFYSTAKFGAYAYVEEEYLYYDWDTNENAAFNKLNGQSNSPLFVNDRDKNEPDETASASMITVGKMKFVKGIPGKYGYVRSNPRPTPEKVILKDPIENSATRAHSIKIFNTSETGVALNVKDVYYNLPIFEIVDVDAPITIKYYEYDTIQNRPVLVNGLDGLGGEIDKDISVNPADSEGVFKFTGFKDKEGNNTSTISIPRNGDTFAPTQYDYVQIEFRTKLDPAQETAAKEALEATASGLIYSYSQAAIYLVNDEELRSFNSSSAYQSYKEKDTDNGGYGNWDKDNRTEFRYISNNERMTLQDGTAVQPGVSIKGMERNGTEGAYTYSEVTDNTIMFPFNVMGWKVKLGNINSNDYADMVNPVIVVELPSGMTPDFDDQGEIKNGGVFNDAWGNNFGKDPIDDMTPNHVPNYVYKDGHYYLWWKFDSQTVTNPNGTEFIIDAKPDANYLGYMTAKVFLYPDGQTFYNVLSSFGTKTLTQLDELIEDAADQFNTKNGVANQDTIAMLGNSAFKSEISVTDGTNTAVSSNPANRNLKLDSYTDGYEYTLKLSNESDTIGLNYKDIVFIDKVPGVGDYSNLYDRERGSTANSFFDLTNIVSDNNGVAAPFTVEYTTEDKDTKFGEADYEGKAAGVDGAHNWTALNYASEPLPEDATAIRIIFGNGVELEPHTDITITFDAMLDTDTLPASDLIAYNSFGFGFKAGSDARQYMSEPDNVGVLAYQESVRGTIFVDSNQNGRYDVGESPYNEDVEVSLYVFDDSDVDPENHEYVFVASTVTENGKYYFSILENAKDYKLEFAIPGGSILSQYIGEGKDTNMFTVSQNNAVGEFETNAVFDNTKDTVHYMDAGIYTRSNPGGGGETYRVVYVANNGLNEGNIIDGGKEGGELVRVKSGSIFTAPNGMSFLGWSDTLTGEVKYNANSAFTMPNEDVYLYAVWTDKPVLNKEDHYAYIIGYPQGDVRPNGNLTRQEAATIFFRLLEDASRDKYFTRNNNFSDVASKHWANTAISTIEKAGIVNGYMDGSFQPGKNITRAEFATMVSRFDGGKYEGEDFFSDISDSWAREAINRAAELGWVQGDGDGKFRPNSFITRAEVMTLTNNVLNRKVNHVDDLHEDMIRWPDNKTTGWYYFAIQEATNAHHYDRKEDDFEIWTELRENPDWKELEKPVG